MFAKLRALISNIPWVVICEVYCIMFAVWFIFGKIIDSYEDVVLVFIHILPVVCAISVIMHTKDFFTAKLYTDKMFPFLNGLYMLSIGAITSNALDNYYRNGMVLPPMNKIVTIDAFWSIVIGLSIGTGVIALVVIFTPLIDNWQLKHQSSTRRKE